jgi:hypothetical protein
MPVITATQRAEAKGSLELNNVLYVCVERERERE